MMQASCTARSSSQVLVDFKLWLLKSNEQLIKILDKPIKYSKNSRKNIYTIMPGFTHLKNAQPISLHYILAYIEMFNRIKN